MRYTQYQKYVAAEIPEVPPAADAPEVRPVADAPDIPPADELPQAPLAAEVPEVLPAAEVLEVLPAAEFHATDIGQTMVNMVNMPDATDDIFDDQSLHGDLSSVDAGRLTCFQDTYFEEHSFITCVSCTVLNHTMSDVC